MCDYFVHTIKELQGSDSTLQAHVDLNGPLHSKWVGLPDLVSQLVTNKQLILLTSQTMTLEKTLEEILRDIKT